MTWTKNDLLTWLYASSDHEAYELEPFGIYAQKRKYNMLNHPSTTSDGGQEGENSNSISTSVTSSRHKLQPTSPSSRKGAKSDSSIRKQVVSLDHARPPVWIRQPTSGLVGGLEFTTLRGALSKDGLQWIIPAVFKVCSIFHRMLPNFFTNEH